MAPSKKKTTASSSTGGERKPRARTTSKRATAERPAAEADADVDGENEKSAPAIDAVLSNLERVVRQLEGGELPLEKALEQFEEGVRLARRGSALLDAVEQRVEVLLADSDDVAPFSEHAGDAQ